MEGLWGARVPWRGGCRLCAWENRAACVSCAKRDALSFGMLKSCGIVGSCCSMCPVLVEGQSWRASGAEVRAVRSGRVGAGMDN